MESGQSVRWDAWSGGSRTHEAGRPGRLCGLWVASACRNVGASCELVPSTACGVGSYDDTLEQLSQHLVNYEH